MTATTFWRDAIYWSSDNTTDSDDKRLAIVNYDGDGLKPNEAYTVITSITVPRYISGDYWAFAEVDYQNHVFEYLDDGNNAAGPKVMFRFFNKAHTPEPGNFKTMFIFTSVIK